MFSSIRRYGYHSLFSDDEITKFRQMLASVAGSDN